MALFVDVIHNSYMNVLSYMAAALTAASLLLTSHFGWSWHEQSPVSTSTVVSSSLVVSNASLSNTSTSKNNNGGNHSSGHSSGGNSNPPKNPVTPPVTPPTTSPTSTPVVPVTPTPTPTPAAGEVYLNAYTTSYAAGDNDPAGSTITYISGIEGNAGGTGTYANPITLAVGYVGEKPDIPAGTKFYIPNVRRYFVVGDTCAECHQTPKGVQVWVDMYAGNASGQGVLACEDTITGNYTIIENPSSTYAVAAGPLYSGTSCTAQFGNTVTH